MYAYTYTSDCTLPMATPCICHGGLATLAVGGYEKSFSRGRKEENTPPRTLPYRKRIVRTHEVCRCESTTV